MTTLTPDFLTRRVAYVERCLRVFHQPGDVVELRALGVHGRRAV